MTNRWQNLLTNRAARLEAEKPVAPAGKQSLRARGRIRKRSGEMNKTEAAFAAYLRTEQVAGRVLWFGFEQVKLRLADNTYFTPDFGVMYANGELWLVDTKGTKKDGGRYKPWVEEDARIKLKVAAETFPFVLAVAYRLPIKAGGNWVIEEV